METTADVLLCAAVCYYSSGVFVTELLAAIKNRKKSWLQRLCTIPIVLPFQFVFMLVTLICMGVSTLMPAAVSWRNKLLFLYATDMCIRFLVTFLLLGRYLLMCGIFRRRHSVFASLVTALGVASWLTLLYYFVVDLPSVYSLEQPFRNNEAPPSAAADVLLLAQLAYWYHARMVVLFNTVAATLNVFQLALVTLSANDIALDSLYCCCLMALLVIFEYSPTTLAAGWVQAHRLIEVVLSTRLRAYSLVPIAYACDDETSPSAADTERPHERVSLPLASSRDYL